MTFDELLNLVSSDKGPNVCVDSRLVKAGDVFVAVEGTVCDGHDFIPQALANGAAYIVCERPVHREDARQITVEDSAEAAALLAQASRGNPADRLINLAVTGTNGKTTVAFLVRSVVERAGSKSGLIGTVVYDTGSGAGFEATLTTPDSLAIAEMTSQMVKNNARYMVIEASSHALSQNRLAGITFRAAAFTNLTGDHLDYHKTTEDYLAAKSRLFSALSSDATAILNRQSPQTERIAAQTRAAILWYAIDEPADITAHVQSMDIDGTTFTINHAGRQRIVQTSLPGRYNVSNCLAAAGMCLAAGFDLDTIATGLSGIQTVPGRLERIDWPGSFSVLVDYAHTDDALTNVLSTLKPLCRGALRVVFGCGGDRDKTKRPRMARAAEQLADYVVVTSDNPRTEHPDDIISEIVAGFQNPVSRKISIEPDRKKAIELALKTAEKDDIVLIAGKGHETYQIIEKEKLHFSDHEIARECLYKRK